MTAMAAVQGSYSLVFEAYGAAVEQVESSFHITFGELAVSVSGVLLAVATLVLVWVSERLVKATTLAANAELAKVSMNANDDMADVAKTAVTGDRHGHSKAKE